MLTKGLAAGGREQQGESHVCMLIMFVRYFTFVPSILRGFHSDPALTPQHAEVCCAVRRGKGERGLTWSPCPSWGGCYGTALVVDRLRCGVTKGGRSAVAGVEASKEAHAYATRGSTSWPPVRTSACPKPLALVQPSTLIVRFSYWQDSTSGGGTTTVCGRNRVSRIDGVPKGNSNNTCVVIMEYLCSFPNWVKVKSRYL